MQFICDTKGALLCYATPSPAIDEPSAGYIFTWDMLGNGAHVAFDQFDGEKGTHTEFVEGLMSTDSLTGSVCSSGDSSRPLSSSRSLMTC